MNSLELVAECIAFFVRAVLSAFDWMYDFLEGQEEKASKGWR